MPESLFSRRLKLGTFLGIDLFVHWSFALLVLFVGLTSLGGGWALMVFAIGQLFGVFFCVTLHEYGHAMAARALGIGTADITLLPIGGVARLRRMPRIPWQELVVAVAGPAVNVVIVAMLSMLFWFLVDAEMIRGILTYAFAVLTGGSMESQMHATVEDFLMRPSWLGFGVSMIVINAMLVIFNMIPAFPMDGGRVFRSILAMTMNYARATSIASKVGLVCAAFIAIGALSASPPNPIPVLIAAFIGYAGIAESRQVTVMESVRGLKVGQVMIQSDLVLSMDTPLSQIARIWTTTAQPAIPVVSMHGTVVGMLRLSDVAKAMDGGVDKSISAGQLVNHDEATATIYAQEDLASAIAKGSRVMRQMPVVDFDGKLVGILDLESMLVRRGLQPPQGAGESDFPPNRFDAIN